MRVSDLLALLRAASLPVDTPVMISLSGHPPISIDHVVIEGDLTDTTGATVWLHGRED